MKLVLLFVFVPVVLFAQKTTQQIIKRLGPNPLKIIDSVKVSNDEFEKTDANDISLLTVMYDTSAMKIYGEEAKDGAVICETKGFARKQYISFFRKKSARYDSLYTITQNDSTFQYIVNDKVKTNNYEGTLAMINDKLFISLEILTADDLKNKYNITGKSYGILIYSSDPPGLRHIKGN
jgi:hypothetical protein